jgi:hypothetical protein
LFDKLLPFAIEAGIDAREYWLYSIAEINATIAAYKQRLKTKASLDYTLANLIAANVAASFSKNGKVPSIYEAYPNLIEFERPKQQD